MHRIDRWSPRAVFGLLPALVVLALVSVAAPPPLAAGGAEASLNVPDLGTVTFGGGGGRALLLWGLGASALGPLLGKGIFSPLKNLPGHRPIHQPSEPTYQTYK